MYIMWRIIGNLACFAHSCVCISCFSLSQASNMTVQLFTVPSLVSHSCIISVLRSYNPECVQPTLCFAGENQLVYQLGLLFHSPKPWFEISSVVHDENLQYLNVVKSIQSTQCYKIHNNLLSSLSLLSLSSLSIFLLSRVVCLCWSMVCCVS